MENKLHNFGLVRFSKKTGKIDKTMTALGCGMIQLWALQNTTKTKACVIIDIDEGRIYREYVGTEEGFPKVNKSEREFEFGNLNSMYRKSCSTNSTNSRK